MISGYCKDPAVFRDLVANDVEFLESVHGMTHRILPTMPSEQWWVARAEVLDFKIFCLNSAGLGSSNIAICYRAHKMTVSTRMQASSQE